MYTCIYVYMYIRMYSYMYTYTYLIIGPDAAGRDAADHGAVSGDEYY